MKQNQYIIYKDKINKSNKYIYKDLFSDSTSDSLSIKKELYEYDFNSGFRIKFYDDREYRLLIVDKHDRRIYSDINFKPYTNVIYSFCKKYYIDYEIIIFDLKYSKTIPIDVIRFDVSNQDIMIMLSTEHSPPGLGDSIAWMNAVLMFKERHKQANVYIVTEYPDMDELLHEFGYDTIVNIISLDDVKNYSFYATYIMGCFFDDKELYCCPSDYKSNGLIEYACKILGMEYDGVRRLVFEYGNSMYKSTKPYVCFGTHASGIYKEWLCDSGWNHLSYILKQCGYDIYVIDRRPDNLVENNIIRTRIPENNVIDMTGEEHTLLDRVKMLSGCDFFVGCSSGLSWLAWCCGVPVVMISGFTNPLTEFYTPYRVINYDTCNSCWNDPRIKWNMNETFCPRCKNIMGESFLECSTSISAYMVFDKIKEIPIVKERLSDKI